jgi:2-polyprenyl-3-methyl-5-hydroxy-6-metoxy-1,4-benzoquinol methylase
MSLFSNQTQFLSENKSVAFVVRAHPLRPYGHALHEAMCSTGMNANTVGATSLNARKVEAFGTRMLTLLNNGATTLMISVGHKTGLFETMAALPASTSDELAVASGLHERYVREWLAAMYVSGIVEISKASGEDKKEKSGGAANRYKLPAENAAFLTWGRGPENVAVLAQYISLLSAFEGKTVDCFRNGGGIPSAEFGDLKAVMAADSAQTIAASLVDWIVPMGGEQLVQDLQAGIDVLDIQCGTGMNLLTLAAQYPMSWFTGYDTDGANIQMAQKAAAKETLRNIRFKRCDILTTSELSSYDLITCFGSLVETGDPRGVLARAQAALRRGGTLLLQDVAASSDARANREHPAGPLMYTVSVMFTVPSSIAKTGNDEKAMGTMWGNDSALRMIREVGLTCEGPKQLQDDHCNVFFFCTRDH